MIARATLHEEFYGYLKQVKPKEEFIEVFNAVFLARYEQRQKEIQGEYFQKVDDIQKLKDEQKWLLERGKKGVIPDELLKQQLDELEQKLTLAQMGLNDTYQEKIGIENLLNEAYTFCRTPEIAWYNALPEAQVKYQRLIFPSGISYHFTGLSNQELGLPFKLISTIGSNSPTNVGGNGVEPFTSYLSDKRSTAELTALLATLEGKLSYFNIYDKLWLWQGMKGTFFGDK